ncbi:MAG: Ldh family oxidoreductase [Acidimicrobiales bacterium]
MNEAQRGVPEMTRTKGQATELPIDGVRAFAATALTAAGMMAGDADTVAGNFLWADLRGVDTHGVQRLSWYLGWFEQGICNPAAQLEVLRERPTLVSGDGHHGLGQLVATRLMERVIPKAKESGMCIGVIRNSNDWGCGGWYPNLAAQAGLASMVTTTSIPNLAPFGARTRLYGNNPIAFAFPRRNDPPILLDMALTPVALGKVLRAQAEGTELPAAWGFQDRDGNPTTDPATAMKGIIPAIGGYKGTGLAMITNILAGVLSGSAHSAGVEVGRRGQFFLAMDPDVLHPEGVDAYFEAMEDLVSQVRAVDVLEGQQVFLPGEPEQRQLEARSAAGVIRYPGSVIDGLRKVADRLGLPFDLA